MGHFLGNPKGRAGTACAAIENGGGTVRVNGRVANGKNAFLNAIDCLDPYSLGSLVKQPEEAQSRMEQAQLPNQYIPNDMGKGRPLINVVTPNCIINNFDLNWH